MHHEQLEEDQLEAQENLCTLSNVTTFRFSPKVLMWRVRRPSNPSFVYI